MSKQTTTSQADFFAKILAEPKPEPELTAPVPRTAYNPPAKPRGCRREFEAALRELVPEGAPDFWLSVYNPFWNAAGVMQGDLQLLGETFWHCRARVSGQPGSYTFVWSTDLDQPSGSPCCWDAATRRWVIRPFHAPG